VRPERKLRILVEVVLAAFSAYVVLGGSRGADGFVAMGLLLIVGYFPKIFRRLSLLSVELSLLASSAVCVAVASNNERMTIIAIGGAALPNLGRVHFHVSSDQRVDQATTSAVPSFHRIAYLWWIVPTLVAVVKPHHGGILLEHTILVLLCAGLLVPRKPFVVGTLFLGAVALSITVMVQNTTWLSNDALEIWVAVLLAVIAIPGRYLNERLWRRASGVERGSGMTSTHGSSFR
jgi:hypothetical protein